MADSFISYALPFADDAALHAQYVGGAISVRTGRLLEDLDSLAGSCAYRHVLPAGADIADARAHGLYIVTAAVDRIDLLRPLSAAAPENLRLSGFVSFCSRSTMEVLIVLESDGAAGVEAGPVLVARFTMACRDGRTAQARAVPQLAVDGADEDAIVALGRDQRERKLAAQASSLDVAAPSAEESARLHRLFSGSFTPSDGRDAPPADVVLMQDSGLSTAVRCPSMGRGRADLSAAHDAPARAQRARRHVRVALEPVAAC